MKYVMFSHGGSDNHGCEAIVRSTINILGDRNKYYLQSFSPKSDKKFGLDKHSDIITSKTLAINRWSPLGLLMRLKSRMNPSIDFDTRESIYRHKKLLKNKSIALSIGGDNYCYGQGIVDSIRDQLTALNAKCIPAVLWGCSINPEKLNAMILKDLKKFSLIIARESITADALCSAGLSEKVFLCSDPAFTLPKQKTNWNSDIFKNNSVIGINLSPLMKSYETYNNATYNNFKALVEYLIKNTDYYIALIPHVIQPGNNDLEISRKLANEIGSDRILLLDKDYNCMQLKDIISKCDMFIGCRTHSTIAAYSTCVPALVVGYSTKAKGIAKDIFGDYSDLIVDVRDFESDNDLLNKFILFNGRYEELKTYLKKNMPEYIKRAYVAKDKLEEFQLTTIKRKCEDKSIE